MPVWHGQTDLRGLAAVILPGGFSYGDYLRCGAIARFAPVMSELIPAARDGLPVLGICNGFQILCEAHLLPGALTRNAALRFINRAVRVRIEDTRTPWTADYAAGSGDHRGAEERRGRVRGRSGHAGPADRERAGAWPGTRAATRTARWATSPGCAARPGTWSG